MLRRSAEHASAAHTHASRHGCPPASNNLKEAEGLREREREREMREMREMRGREGERDEGVRERDEGGRQREREG